MVLVRRPCDSTIKLDENVLSRFKEILEKISVGNRKEGISGDLESRMNQVIDYMGINSEFSLKAVEVISSYEHALTKPITLKLLRKLIKDTEISFELLTAEECKNLIEYKLAKIEEEIEVLYGNFSQLKETLTSLERETIHREIAFLVLFPDSPHTTPIILRKSENRDRVQIICTDSVGYEHLENRTYTETIINYLNRVEKKVDFYFFKTQRQYDFSNCAVFAISDVISYCKLRKRKYDLFAHVENYSYKLQKNELYKISELSEFLSAEEVEKISAPLFIFEKIPPVMMKLTQSQATISAYLKKYPEYECEIVQKKQNETLSENIRRYTFFNLDERRQNIHAEIRYARLIVILFKRYTSLAAEKM